MLFRDYEHNVFKNMLFEYVFIIQGIIFEMSKKKTFNVIFKQNICRFRYIISSVHIKIDSLS